MIAGRRCPAGFDNRTCVLLASIDTPRTDAQREHHLTRHDQERRQRILDCIAQTVEERGYPPSVREIAEAVGLASTSAVHHHLIALEREGYLERGATQSRAIRLTPTAALRVGLSSELVPQS